MIPSKIQVIFSVKVFNDWNKEDFDKLTESQLKWIEKKTKIEEEYKNDDLVRYQTLIEMTLDKCEEWTEYYR